MDKVTQAYGLGKMTAPPERVSGGLMHRMDKVYCEKGIYAVKTLNRQVMARPAAYRNMILSERIAFKLSEFVPAVFALTIDGNIIHAREKDMYMVFPWVEGKSLFPPELNSVHCERIGDILGRIHKADVRVDDVIKEYTEKTPIDWPSVPNDLRAEEWIHAYCPFISKLEIWHNDAVCAVDQLSSWRVISHRDLDPKNVLWQGLDPWLIDWEAAGYINPLQEMLETAFYWADDGKGGLDEEKFVTFIHAYEQHISLKEAPWQMIGSACFLGMLEWLHYNVRRALGEEATGEQEMQLGKEQVVSTIQALYALEKKNKTVLGLINNR